MKYKIFSAFDGIGCGQIAVNREGIEYDEYYSSEIDKLAMQIANRNYPNTIQLGDINIIKGSDLPKIDLMMGGSPCQGFSKAGKQENFNDPRSRLIYEFGRLYAEIEPTYFLLENVYMKKAYQNIISSLLGVEPICINSNLVSAQNRKRLYWTNIPVVGLPKDKNIYLKDIVEDDVYPVAFTERRTEEAKQIRREYRKSQNIDFCPRRAKEIVKRTDGKFNCLTATFSNKEHMLELKSGGMRKVSPLECERLQTVPEHYTSGLTDNQRRKLLGNGWTVDVIAFILSFLPKQ